MVYDKILIYLTVNKLNKRLFGWMKLVISWTRYKLSKFSAIDSHFRTYQFRISFRNDLYRRRWDSLYSTSGFILRFLDWCITRNSALGHVMSSPPTVYLPTTATIPCKRCYITIPHTIDCGRLSPILLYFHELNISFYKVLWNKWHFFARLFTFSQKKSHVLHSSNLICVSQ